MSNYFVSVGSMGEGCEDGDVETFASICEDVFEHLSMDVRVVIGSGISRGDDVIDVGNRVFDTFCGESFDDARTRVALAKQGLLPPAWCADGLGEEGTEPVWIVDRETGDHGLGVILSREGGAAMVACESEKLSFALETGACAAAPHLTAAFGVKVAPHVVKNAIGD